jgi:hypothetical protein
MGILQTWSLRVGVGLDPRLKFESPGTITPHFQGLRILLRVRLTSRYVVYEIASCNCLCSRHRTLWQHLWSIYSGLYLAFGELIAESVVSTGQREMGPHDQVCRTHRNRYANTTLPRMLGVHIGLGQLEEQARGTQVRTCDGHVLRV